MFIPINENKDEVIEYTNIFEPKNKESKQSNRWRDLLSGIKPDSTLKYMSHVAKKFKEAGGQYSVVLLEHDCAIIVFTSTKLTDYVWKYLSRKPLS